MLDVIKEYLVSLGFHVDTSSYGQTVKAMNDVDATVSKFAGNAVSQFAAAGAAVTTFVVLANVGMAKFLGGLAKADLENEKFARQMWTSKDAAVAYNNTLKAMGATMQDLYLSPELLKNFQELRQQAINMRAPDELSGQLKFIRSIQFEFQRMKLEATYALQWIGYYLIKYMDGPLKKAKEGLKSINDSITKSMPHWTKQIAMVMSWFARMGIAGFKAFKGILELAEKIPNGIKLIGLALAALGLLIKTGPLGVLVLLFTGLIVLLDDFFTYLDGGESLLGDFWSQLSKFKESDEYKNLVETFENLWKTLLKIKKDLVDSKVFETLWADLKDVGSSLLDMLNSLSDIVKSLSDLGVFKVFGEVIKGAADLATGAVETLNLALKTTKELLTGDFKSAGKVFSNGVVDYVKQGTDRSKKSDPWFYENIMPKLLDFNKWIKDNLADPTNNFIDNLLGLQNRMAAAYPSQPGTIRNNTFSPTFNVYGSEPNATARAVERNTEDLYMRNLQGVID